MAQLKQQLGWLGSHPIPCPSFSTPNPHSILARHEQPPRHPLSDARSHNQISFPSSPMDSQSTDELANDADDEDEAGSDPDHPQRAHFSRFPRSHITSQAPPQLPSFPSDTLARSASISIYPRSKPPSTLCRTTNAPSMPRRKLVKRRNPLPPDTSALSYASIPSEPRPSSSASITTLVRVSRIPISRPCSVPLDDPRLTSLKEAHSLSRSSCESNIKASAQTGSVNSLTSKPHRPHRSSTLPSINTTWPFPNEHWPVCKNSSPHSSPIKIPADCRLGEGWDSNQILAELNLGPTGQTQRSPSSEGSETVDVFATPLLETSHQQPSAKPSDAFDEEHQNDSGSSLDPEEFLSKVAGNVAKTNRDTHLQSPQPALYNSSLATSLQYTHSSPLNTSQAASENYAGRLQAKRRSRSIGTFQLGHKPVSASVHSFHPMALHSPPPCRRSLDLVNTSQLFESVQRPFGDDAQPKNSGSANKARTSPRAIDEFDSKLALLQRAIDSGNIDSLDVPSLIKWEDDSSGENDDGQQASGHLPRRTSDVNLTSSIVYSSHPFPSPKTYLSKSSSFSKPSLSVCMPSSIPRSSSFESIRSAGGEFPISERTIKKSLNKPLLSETLTLGDEDSNGEFEELHDLHDLAPDLELDQREGSPSHFNSFSQQNTLAGSDGCVASASHVSSGTGGRSLSEDDYPPRASFDQRLTEHRRTLINMQRQSQESLTGSSDMKRPDGQRGSQDRARFPAPLWTPQNSTADLAAGVYLPHAPTSPVPPLRHHSSRPAIKPRQHVRSSSFISITLKKLTRKLQPKQGSDCPSVERLSASEDRHPIRTTTHLSRSSHAKPLVRPTHAAMQQSVSYESRAGQKPVSHLRGMSVGAVTGWSGLGRLQGSRDGRSFNSNVHTVPLTTSPPQHERLSCSGDSPPPPLPQTSSLTTDHLPEPGPQTAPTPVASAKPAELLRLNDILKRHQQDEKDYMKKLAQVVLERKVLSEQSPSTM